MLQKVKFDLLLIITKSGSGGSEINNGKAQKSELTIDIIGTNLLTKTADTDFKPSLFHEM